MFAVSLARHWSKKFARLPFDISRCFRVPLWFISSTSSLKSSSRYLLLYELNKEGCLAARHGGNCSWLPLLRLPGTSGQFFSAARMNLGLCLVVWFSRLLFFVLRGFFSFRFAPSLVVILSFCVVVEHSLVHLCCNSVPRQCAVFSLGLLSLFCTVSHRGCPSREPLSSLYLGHSNVLSSGDRCDVNFPSSRHFGCLT